MYTLLNPTLQWDSVFAWVSLFEITVQNIGGLRYTLNHSLEHEQESNYEFYAKTTFILEHES